MLSDELKNGKLLIKSAVNANYHYDYKSVYINPFVQLGYDITSNLNFGASIGKKIYFPKLNSGMEELEPRKSWQVRIGAFYKPIFVDYTYKTNSDTCEIHQLTTSSKLRYKDFSMNINYALTFAKNPKTNFRLPYQPRHSITANLDWDKRFFHDNLKLHGRLSAKYNSWVATDYWEYDFIDEFLLFDGKVEMKIYDLSVSYNVNNITWQHYSRVQGYPLWRKIYLIKLRWEFWN